MGVLALPLPVSVFRLPPSLCEIRWMVECLCLFLLWLTGETIVGDGTTAQLSAMLTGVEEKHQVDARRRITNSQPVDSWRWIFKDYKDKGYATMFSEDSPYLASFNYRLHGFKDPPTDHYARPFWMEADNHINGYCINNRASHDVSLKYLLSLFRR